MRLFEELENYVQETLGLLFKALRLKVQTFFRYFGSWIHWDKPVSLVILVRLTEWFSLSLWSILFIIRKKILVKNSQMTMVKWLLSELTMVISTMNMVGIIYKIVNYLKNSCAPYSSSLLNNCLPSTAYLTIGEHAIQFERRQELLDAKSN